MTNASALERFTADSLDGWSDMVRRHVMTLEISSPDKDFRASIHTHRIGDCDAFFIRAGEQYVTRPRRIDADDDNRFYLMQAIGLGHKVRHCGKDLTLLPGQCMLLDTAREFSFAFPDGAQNLLIRIPTARLLGRLPWPEALAGEPLALSGWSAPLCSFMGNLRLTEVDEMPLRGDELAEHLLGLLALAAGRDRTSQSYRGCQYDRINQSIRALCAEAELSPAVVAKSVGVSARTLHAIMQANGETFSAMLFEVRLAQAHRMLQSPSFADVALNEIARRCGFKQQSHFSRRFRDRFGMSPKQARTKQ